MADYYATRDFQSSMSRIQTSILARPERWLLNRLCAVLAGRVSPDQLTVLGLLGGGLVFLGYALSSSRPGFFWLAIFGFVLHWFGDSLDGSLARHMGQERPRYGYFTDHAVDALANLMIMAGLGLTLYVRMDIALFALCGYFMLSMYVFLKQQAQNIFQLTFLVMGPTELRVCLIGLSLLMLYVGPILVGGYSFYDLLIGATGGLFVLIFIWSVFGTAMTLRRDGV